MVVNSQFLVFVSINNEQNPVMFHVVFMVLFIAIFLAFIRKKTGFFSKFNEKTQD